MADCLAKTAYVYCSNLFDKDAGRLSVYDDLRPK